MRRAALATLVGAAVLAGCKGFEPTVRRVMSADARCPEEKIDVARLAGGGYQATGCAKTAVYDCSWPEGAARSCVQRGAPPAKALPGTGY